MKFKDSTSPRYKDVYDILAGKHPTFQSTKLRNKLFEANLKEKKCECCGITSWQGKEISFELNHKDGIGTNHSLDNLELLCPNCHSQTPTYKGRNKGNGRHERRKRYAEGKSY